MTDQEIIKTFQDVGALLDGHFVLRSKLHSDKFFQAALLFKYPDIAEKLCRTLAERMKGLGAETVISPGSRWYSRRAGTCARTQNPGDFCRQGK